MLKDHTGKYLTFLAGLVLIFTLPLWIENPYIIHIFIMMYLNIVLAMGLTMIFKAGALSFGHAAYAGIGAYTSVLLLTRLEVPFWVAFLLAGLLTAIIAFFIGGITLGVRGIYFTITTFAFTEVLKGIYTAYPNPFGGPGGIRGIPGPPGIETKVQFYYLALIFVLISFFIFYRLASGRFSFSMICDGLKLNELLEECLGINTKTVRIVVFVVGCTFAGFTGSLMAHYLRQINPESFAIHMSIDIIIFCAAGGFGSIFGSVIGATSLTFIGELLYGVGAYKSLIFGAILIVIILFIPEGFVGLASRRGIKFILKNKGIGNVSSA